jgi:hypothetical protein
MRDDGGIRDSETNDGMCRGGGEASDCALEVIGRNLETTLFSGVRRDEAKRDVVRGKFLMKTHCSSFGFLSRTVYYATSKPQSEG